VIAVDTSALMAILLNEPQSEACIEALQADPHVAVSAGTLAEALVVASGRKVSPDLIELIDTMAVDVVPVTRDSALRAGDAFSRWGKGAHRAGLNFGDCFAYALAKERACPLLYVGRDFAQTDIASVL
jgi:ribonuclease VapC